ncbi:hypothetical protein C2845_PM12G10760 [Panicum miliaceum]|uniref:Ubiquitin-like protease family profile domain-containing protein n=1 Tax=Panicum miliaceum TaxID=4540 RepID=A0A3L6QGV4_PANMI|nr:hypothetical protein C2845_PM12G10760 [Panicum miliaceum]
MVRVEFSRIRYFAYLDKDEENSRDGYFVRKSVDEKEKTEGTAASVWTKDNPKYKPGEPMLSEEDLNVVRPSSLTLHNHYMVQSACGVENIFVSYQECHFGSDTDTFPVQFCDLYDLFNLDALDISLLRCFSLKMYEPAKDMGIDVGFLDPQIFSATMIQCNSNTVIIAIAKPMNHDFVVGAYNTGGHWVLVVIVMKWNIVFYLDFAKQVPKQKFQDVQQVINCALGQYMLTKGETAKSKSTPKLTHKTDFKLHQISKDSYVMIREMISNFIESDVIPPEGRYYVQGGYQILAGSRMQPGNRTVTYNN